MLHRDISAESLRLPSGGIGPHTLARHFAFVAPDARHMFLAEMCADVLATANRLIGETRFEWSIHAGPEGITGNERRIVVLLGGTDEVWQPDEEAVIHLRRLNRAATRICAVGGAVLALARIGAIGAHRLAIGPMFRPAVSTLVPRAEIVDLGVCHHRRVTTAVGPAAALRMMTEIVTIAEGIAIGRGVSQTLGIVDEVSHAPACPHSRAASGDPLVLAALRLMRDHIEDTVSTRDISMLLDVSPRHLERRFRETLGSTPLRVYRDLRLDHAHQLVSQSDLPLDQIAASAGFNAVSNLRKWFEERYSETPERLRRRATCGVLG